MNVVFPPFSEGKFHRNLRSANPPLLIFKAKKPRGIKEEEEKRKTYHISQKPLAPYPAPRASRSEYLDYFSSWLDRRGEEMIFFIWKEKRKPKDTNQLIFAHHQKKKYVYVFYCRLEMTRSHISGKGGKPGERRGKERGKSEPCRGAMFGCLTEEESQFLQGLVEDVSTWHCCLMRWAEAKTREKKKSVDVLYLGVLNAGW